MARAPVTYIWSQPARRAWKNCAGNAGAIEAERKAPVPRSCAARCASPVAYCESPVGGGKPGAAAARVAAEAPSAAPAVRKSSLKYEKPRPRHLRSCCSTHARMAGWEGSSRTQSCFGSTAPRASRFARSLQLALDWPKHAAAPNDLAWLGSPQKHHGAQ